MGHPLGVPALALMMAGQIKQREVNEMNAKFFECYAEGHTPHYATEDEATASIDALRSSDDEFTNVEFSDIYQEVEIADLPDHIVWGETSDETQEAINEARAEAVIGKLEQSDAGYVKAPTCPVCGMPAQRNEDDAEWCWACGHYIDHYNPWMDGLTEVDRLTAARLSTHIVVTHDQMSADTEWFFAGCGTLDEVMTTSEIAARYSLAEATVRQAIYRESLSARQSGSTWLVLRSIAEKRWGGKARSIALLLVSLGLTAIIWTTIFV